MHTCHKCPTYNNSIKRTAQLGVVLACLKCVEDLAVAIARLDLWLALVLDADHARCSFAAVGVRLLRVRARVRRRAGRVLAPGARDAVVLDLCGAWVSAAAVSTWARTDLAASTVILLVSTNVLLKKAMACLASFSVRKPIKAKRRDLPSLHSVSARFGRCDNRTVSS